MNDRENPLMAAKLRRLLGAAPGADIPDQITPEQITLLHYEARNMGTSERRTERQAIWDAIKASGIIKTCNIDGAEIEDDPHLFDPIPLIEDPMASIQRAVTRRKIPERDRFRYDERRISDNGWVTVAVEKAKRTKQVVSRAALAEWWPRLGIPAGPVLAAWMESGLMQEEAAACMEEVAASQRHGRLVGWKKSVNTAWPNLLQIHQRKPTVEELVRFLERDDQEGFIRKSGVPDELEWRPKKGGKKKPVSRRTIEDYIGTLPGPRD